MKIGKGESMQGQQWRSVVELVLEFAIMYLVMYTMIATVDHFYLNLNNVYMTLMMLAPMTLLMRFLMPAMHSQSRAGVWIAASVLVFILAYGAMRKQSGIGEAQFLRSMIPHHSGAILMCEQATLSDPEIVGLCRDIVAAQKREITQMQAILSRH